MTRWTPLALLAMAAVALADPCGMVPPIYTGDGPPITRIGLQKTYVFHRNGIESFVIRPGYRGQVEHFGMLIPFPSPPAIRKVADDVFPHLAAAVDPPPVMAFDWDDFVEYEMSAVDEDAGGEAPLAVDQVNVLREEAIGMYEVAVLEAGSAAALQRWMSDHGYQYPEGMDATCEDYVAQGWCFVAVKTRVGRMAAVKPKPGMRQADPSLPEGAGFDGHVQAMGFRFRSERLVVPMRLSAFNEGELRNVIYVLADEPLKLERLPESFVKRQLPGAKVFRNLTEPLPVLVPRWMDEAYAKRTVEELRGQWISFAQRRDPRPHNGLARDLLAADLLASEHDRLANPVEEREKELLNVGERLGLRDDMDPLHREALAAEHEQAAEEALHLLKGMTLTVIDGDFPRELLAKYDLTFTSWRMPAEANTRAQYEATSFAARQVPTQGSAPRELWFGGGEAPVPLQPLPAGWAMKED